MNLTMFIIAAIVAIIFIAFTDRIYQFYLYYQKSNQLPGPNSKIPFYGFGLEFSKVPKEDQMEWTRIKADGYKNGFMRTWLGFDSVVHIRKPEHIEVILRSTSEITKSDIYDFLVPWMGRGLVTSTGDLWVHHRKLITPAFHFSILENFSEVIIKKAAILNSCIEQAVIIHGQKPFDIFELTVRCALDIICETAMGTNIHAQQTTNGDKTSIEYINAEHTIIMCALQRIYRPWLKPDWMFYNTSYGKSFKAATITAHDFCTRVIKRKLKERQSSQQNNNTTGKKTKKAFLDLLIEANEREVNPLTIEELRDETNTFMFAGHDTTGSLIGWTLFCLGNDLEIQKKVHQELDEILGDSDDHATIKKISNLKYLERVLKEVMRLYPIVSTVSRCLQRDLQMREHNIPAGTAVVIQIYQLHRDSSVWPDPLRFDPDRFTPENAQGRHPYAYIPFSAGPRNCIGQKFALLEAKIVLAQVLRKYSVKSINTFSEVKVYSEIVIKPVGGIFVNVHKRSTEDK